MKIEIFEKPQETEKVIRLKLVNDWGFKNDIALVEVNEEGKEIYNGCLLLVRPTGIKLVKLYKGSLPKNKTAESVDFEVIDGFA